MRLTFPAPTARRPTVSVVIPCYNYGHFLPEAVGSVLGQPDIDAEVVIVDDASPDGSATVARGLAAADARVTTIVHPANAGHIQTYNDGLAAATGEFVALVSADDILAPGSLGRAARLMMSRPSVGMVYGLPQSFEATPPAARRAVESWTVWKGSRWIGHAAHHGRNFILSPEVVVRTRALHQVGFYNPGLPHSGDLEYWLRVASLWDVGRVNGPIHAYYRVHSLNMHTTTFATMPVDLRHRLDAFAVLLGPGLPSGAPAFPDAYSAASRAIAREAVRLAIRSFDTRAGVDETDGLLSFAAQTWPGVRGTRAWDAAGRRRDRASEGLRPTVLDGLSEVGRQQSDRVAYRTWKYAGIR